MNAFRIAAIASLVLLTAGGAVARPNVPADPDSSVAASRILPLGTAATVTNLQNGRSALVHVQDLGSRAHGRILDVAPRVADQLGMKQAGEVPVVVAPIVVSQPNGAMSFSTGAVEVSPREFTGTIKAATATR